MNLCHTSLPSPFLHVSCTINKKPTLYILKLRIKKHLAPFFGGRRMAERAGHLVDHVFPDAPVWQAGAPAARFVRGGVEGAKNGRPISRLLKATITHDAQLM